jgi:cob(I)alamin adenosyltransferase
MVYLNRIYTRQGDGGETSLGDGTRVAKTSARIAAYGGVDELNTLIGVALGESLPDEIADWLRLIQNDLFDLGADLCVPESGKKDSADSSSQPEPLRLALAQVATLEGWIDQTNQELQPLKSFVLPGGTPAAARLHHARAVCRRVEIGVLQLAEGESVNPSVVVYLNRLSDLLFVLARVCNDKGRDDAVWIPGEHRPGQE